MLNSTSTCCYTSTPSKWRHILRSNISQFCSWSYDKTGDPCLFMWDSNVMSLGWNVNIGYSFIWMTHLQACITCILLKALTTNQPLPLQDELCLSGTHWCCHVPSQYCHVNSLHDHRSLSRAHSCPCPGWVNTHTAITAITIYVKKLQFIHTVNGDRSKTAKIRKRHYSPY